MILRRRWSPAVLLLLASLLASEALVDAKTSKIEDTANLNAMRPPTDTTVMVSKRNAAAGLGTQAGPIGTKDAPVDGKDGMPHDGPFVETNAERSRKKSKETGDEEIVPTALKTAVDKDIPLSNDGVMDDAGRRGPAEGTRGTEGGVSGKSSSKITDKKPDPPRESPPLPHSETEKLTDKTKDELKAALEDGEDAKLLAVSTTQTLMSRCD
jgi:Ca2+/H+ antiporter, TMEM165/GDT1 family